MSSTTEDTLCLNSQVLEGDLGFEGSIRIYMEQKQECALFKHLILKYLVIIIRTDVS